MSNPDTAAAQSDFPEVEDKSTEAETTFDTADYEMRVNEACNQMEFNDEGKWVPPEGMPPEMQFAVNAERRRRDTQASLTKTNQALKTAEAKVSAVAEKLESKVAPSLTVEQAEELEDLKINDPEAWRAKLNEYDAAAYAKYEEEMETIDSNAFQVGEVERREALLEQFTNDNPELKLDDNVFNNDLPQRITGKLSDGESTFEEFLEEAKEFLTKGKKIANTEEEELEPNLGKSRGTSTATDTAVEADIVQSYKDEVI